MVQIPNTDTAKLYFDRAEADYRQSSELLKSGIQLAFAANGGASIAILSWLTAIATAKHLTFAVKVSAIVPKFTAAVAIYGFGVLLVALALWAFSLSKEKWGHFWEHNALNDSVEYGNVRDIRAAQYAKAGLALFVFSAVAFITGSGLAVSAFLV